MQYKSFAINNNQMEEHWKNIPGYEGHYMISDLGNLKSLKYNKERLLKFLKNEKGYLYCFLSKENNQKKFKVHQLVSMAFLNHIPCGMKSIIDHIDDDKLNNKVDNLRIVTAYENHGRVKNGLASSKYRGVYFDKLRNKWRAQTSVKGLKRHIGYFNDELEASIAYESFCLLNNN
jgi:hypothetical protein